ncbi:hypothetical protein [Mycobacteroides abscessus]|uniref:hypothetical protein n=1 Tax=Mycobacteroides abscessus TaxID=36809 RepID=UPI0005E0AA82|nr:hypothetical protein [Mycobacteroides abscessus]CPW83091.1 Uncharacterised protein [Mycobacteroides abscessus]SHT52177.1 Uncharacterised protein [Mycobacteroides abscessus subsp. abscessus]SHT56648.1 Uncharacterised protein [Mycobacteroides abscessus subsp. abscessus]SHX21134.1 Uncharacterised protein [Mycobacteroides abscessus subsp. abscessus]SKK64760.1 Uncharacterised protein [Mycobacteroides abscessus subsp. abscessus]
MDELISRIDAVLDEPDDEGTDDWAYPWVDAMRWAPPEVALPSGVWEDEPDRALDSGWEYHPDTQVHVIPVEQVSEWERCLETMPRVEREDIAWYVVCHRHKVAGEREVSCGCGNPSGQGDSR